MLTVERNDHPDETEAPPTAKWEATIDPAMTEDDLADAMVSLFAEISLRPGLNLVQFQFKMMRAMQNVGPASPT